MSRPRPLIILAAALAALGLSATAHADDDPATVACTHLARLAETIGVDDRAFTDLETCRHWTGMHQATCDNGDQILACLAGVEADSARALEDERLACQLRCKGFDPGKLEAKPGKKKPEPSAELQRACANLVEIGKQLGNSELQSEAFCIEDLGPVYDECSNGAEVLTCIAGVEGADEVAIGDALVACLDACAPR